MVDRRRIGDLHRFVIVAGLSGAGKSQAMNSFEDLGFYRHRQSAAGARAGAPRPGARRGRERLAIAPEMRMEARSGTSSTRRRASTRARLRCRSVLEAATSAHPALQRNAPEHPLGSRRGFLDAIVRDVSTGAVARRADLVYSDTIDFADLKERIANAFAGGATRRCCRHADRFRLQVRTPARRRPVFDVRFLPNPTTSPVAGRLGRRSLWSRHFSKPIPRRRAFLRAARVAAGVSDSALRRRRQVASYRSPSAVPAGARSVYVAKRVGAHLASDAGIDGDLDDGIVRPVTRPSLRSPLVLSRPRRQALAARDVVGVILARQRRARWLTAEGSNIGINEFVDRSRRLHVARAGSVRSSWPGRRVRRRRDSAVDPLDRRRDDAARQDTIVDALLDDRACGAAIISWRSAAARDSRLCCAASSATPRNLTAVVTVSDDGGSSGRLQKEFGILPPGDIRNCLVALADDEAMVTDLFRYRFSEGEGLTGHSFGNLFLAAMTGITGNFDRAIKESSRVLNIKGRVLPATSTSSAARDVRRRHGRAKGDDDLAATKTPIARSRSIPRAPRRSRSHRRDPRCRCDRARSGFALHLDLAQSARRPASPTKSRARARVKIYICNVMTQPGETDGFTAVDARQDAARAGGRARLRLRRSSTSEPPKRLRDAYAEEGQVPVAPDVAASKRSEFAPCAPASSARPDTLRHDSAAAWPTSCSDSSTTRRATRVVRDASGRRRRRRARDERPPRQ